MPRPAGSDRSSASGPSISGRRSSARSAAGKKAEEARNCGCTHPILYRDTDFVGAVREITGGQGGGRGLRLGRPGHFHAVARLPAAAGDDGLVRPVVGTGAAARPRGAGGPWLAVSHPAEPDALHRPAGRTCWPMPATCSRWSSPGRSKSVSARNTGCRMRPGPIAISRRERPPAARSCCPERRVAATDPVRNRSRGISGYR